MKTLTTSFLLVLATTSLAAARPLHLGFGEPEPVPVTSLPLTTVATVTPDEAELQPLPEAPPHVERTVLGLPRNVGTGDRILRTVVGAALLGTGIFGLASDDHLSSTASAVLIGVSAVPFATAATGYCPLYQALGIDHSF